MFISFNVYKLLHLFFWFDPLLNVHKKQSSNKRILKEIVREGRLQWTRKHANISWRTTLSGWIRWGHLHRYCLVKLRSVIQQRPHDWDGGKRARYLPGDGIQVYNEEESFVWMPPHHCNWNSYEVLQLPLTNRTETTTTPCRWDSSPNAIKERLNKRYYRLKFPEREAPLLDKRE